MCGWSACIHQIHCKSLRWLWCANFYRHTPGPEYKQNGTKPKKRKKSTCILPSPSPKKHITTHAWIPDRQQELKQFRHLWSVKGWRAHHSLLEAVVPGCVTSEVLGLASGFCLWSLWRLSIVPSLEISKVRLSGHAIWIPLEPCQQSFKVFGNRQFSWLRNSETKHQPRSNSPSPVETRGEHSWQTSSPSKI